MSTKLHIATAATPTGLGTHYFYSIKEITEYDRFLSDHGRQMKRFRWRNDEVRRAYEAMTALVKQG